MLHKNWKFILECAAQDKERKTKINHNFNIQKYLLLPFFVTYSQNFIFLVVFLTDTVTISNVYHSIYIILSCIYDLYIIIFFSIFGNATWLMGSQFPNQPSILYLLHWRHEVLTTGLSGKSKCYLKSQFFHLTNDTVFSWQ